MLKIFTSRLYKNTIRILNLRSAFVKNDPHPMIYDPNSLFYDPRFKKGRLYEILANF